MAVKIGDMDQVFEVQESVTAPDETGQDQESWRTLRKWKAALESLSASETFQSRQTGVVVTHKITGWYDADLHANASLRRLKLGERILNIVSPTETGSRRRQLELMVAEVQPWANQNSESA